MKIYKTGEPCPCCGQPIRYTDPAQLRLFSYLAYWMGLCPEDEDASGDALDLDTVGQQ